MSLIDRNNLNYLTTVEQFFLSLKDSGLNLSASDYDLITQWEARGIPVDRLCRAIESGWLKLLKESRPSRVRPSLSRLRDWVEMELESNPS